MNGRQTQEEVELLKEQKQTWYVRCMKSSEFFFGRKKKVWKIYRKNLTQVEAKELADCSNFVDPSFYYEAKERA